MTISYLLLLIKKLNKKQSQPNKNQDTMSNFIISKTPNTQENLLSEMKAMILTLFTIQEAQTFGSILPIVQMLDVYNINNMIAQNLNILDIWDLN